MHSKNKFVLDPTVYGNAARLFNHCCEPNVTTLGVHNEREKNDETVHNVCNDKTDEKLSNLPRVPRFGLFTIRDVSAGEMLVIEYSAGRSKDQLQKVTPCLCGIKKCKKWLFKGGSARVS